MGQVRRPSYSLALRWTSEQIRLQSPTWVRYIQHRNLNKRKTDISEKKTKKPVNAEQGKRLASELGAVAYVECSALTTEGMKNVFDEVTSRD